MKEKRKIIKKADIAVIVICLVAACLIFMFSYGRGGAVAEIISGGETLYTIDLSKVRENYIITLDNGMEIEVEKDAIGIIKSDCPGQDCVKCGMLTRPGQTAVCIPNETLIRLKGKKPGRVPDAVSY